MAQMQRPTFSLVPQPNQGVLGNRAPVLQQSQLPNQIRPQAFVDADFARRQAMASVLSNGEAMAPIQSGSIAEGLARALQVGMQTRAARDQEGRQEQERAGAENERYRREETMRTAAGAANREEMARILAQGGMGQEGVNLQGALLGDREENQMARDNARFEADLGIETEGRRTPIMADRQRQVGGIEMEQSLAQAQGMNPILQERARMDGNERMRVARALQAGQPQGGAQRAARIAPSGYRASEVANETANNFSGVARASFDFMDRVRGGIDVGPGRRILGGRELAGGTELREFTEAAIALQRVAGSGPFTDADADRAEGRVINIFDFPNANLDRTLRAARNALWARRRAEAVEQWVQKNGDQLGFQNYWNSVEPQLIQQLGAMNEQQLRDQFGMGPARMTQRQAEDADTESFEDFQ